MSAAEPEIANEAARSGGAGKSRKFRNEFSTHHFQHVYEENQQGRERVKCREIRPARGIYCPGKAGLMWGVAR